MNKIALTKDFYVSIAYLFYAFSMIDRKMSVEEKKEMIWAIKEAWATDNYGFDSEEIIYETMRSLIKEKIDAEAAYQTFVSYFKTNQQFFSKQINHNLLEACHRICNAENGKNKSELILLAKLHKLIQETQKK